jgi:hypothetical protein
VGYIALVMLCVLGSDKVAHATLAMQCGTSKCWYMFGRSSLAFFGIDGLDPYRSLGYNCGSLTMLLVECWISCFTIVMLRNYMNLPLLHVNCSKMLRFSFDLHSRKYLNVTTHTRCLLGNVFLITFFLHIFRGV